MSAPQFDFRRFEILERRVAELHLTVSLLRSELERLRVYRTYFTTDNADASQPLPALGERLPGDTA